MAADYGMNEYEKLIRRGSEVYLRIEFYVK